MDELFELGETPPRLRGQRCEDCGRVAFPPNPYGCEQCGASAPRMKGQLLTGKGRLLAFVTTHNANQRDIAVPYTVASIALDDGPVIRALMTGPSDAGLEVDDSVEAVIISRESTPGVQSLQLRFKHAGAM